jgi:hypothetical protein
MNDGERPGGGGNHGEIIARSARRRHARDGVNRVGALVVWVWPINQSARGPDQPGLSLVSAWVPIPLSCPGGFRPFVCTRCGVD